MYRRDIEAMKKSNSNEDDCDKTYNSISFGNISSEFHCFFIIPTFLWVRLEFLPIIAQYSRPTGSGGFKNYVFA